VSMVVGMSDIRSYFKIVSVKLLDDTQFIYKNIVRVSGSLN
jgi:hypothetical protein